MINQQLNKEECIYFYVDGHVRIYYGTQAQLTSKYVSRQKLCLSATTEYWVNDPSGMPYLVVSGELHEKLQDVIETQIIPEILKTESKLFLNIIKMICYRAETALAEQLTPFFSRSKEEKRMLVKQIFNTAADVVPDEKNQTLTINLYSLSTPRANLAIEKLCELLNKTESVFPDTNYKLIFKITASQTTKGQEVWCALNETAAMLFQC